MARADNLVSFWQLGEASGTRADSYGTNPLSDNNTVGSGTGKQGNAADFVPGNSEFLSRTSNSTLQSGDIDFTLCAWVKTDDVSATRCVFGKSDGSTTGDYILRIFSTPRFRFTVRRSGAFTDLTANNFGAISADVWYFVVVWHDSVNDILGISVNDTADTVAHASGVQASASDFAIGRLGSFDGQYWDGLIDEVGYWKRVLTSGERTQLYNSGAGVPFTTIVPPPAQSQPSRAAEAVGHGQFGLASALRTFGDLAR